MNKDRGAPRPRGRLRRTKADDASAVFAVLNEVTCEIPLCLDGDDRQQDMRDRVERWCKEGLSWVSLSDHGKVVGFLLVETHSPSVFPPGFDGIDLSYGGIMRAYRGGGRFRALLANATEIGRPLLAVVKHANKGGMAQRLVNAGFVRAPALTLMKDEEDAFIWTPAGKPQANAGRTSAMRLPSGRRR